MTQSIYAERMGSYWEARTFYGNRTINIPGYPRSVHIKFNEEYRWWDLKIIDDYGKEIGISTRTMYGYEVKDKILEIMKAAIGDYNQEYA